MKRKTGLLLMLLGGLCLLAALGFLLFNHVREDRADRFCQEALPDVLLDIAGQKGEPSEEQNPLSPEEMPTVERGGYTYIGVISLPTLQVELPVTADWSDALLKVAPCRFKGSVYQNDLVIMAHNYRAHFGRIGSLKPGDPVYFLDASGVRWSYTVSAIDLLPPTAVEEMTAGEWPLTLFTCSYDKRTRITVRCDRNQKEPPQGRKSNAITD